MNSVMQGGISEDEIERELQTLRNLRRRSASSPGPGALAVDPDLPPPSPTPSASASYTSNDDVTLATPDGLDDGSLFWVPAHLHPELAPGEFKAFLKAHTSADPEDGTAENAGIAPGLARSGSWLARSRSRTNSVRSIGGNDGLGRKRSMLSRQYQPRAGDTVEEEVPPVPARQESIRGGRGGEKGLTLQDLQRLETMVDEVEEGSEDPSRMRSMLRRSLSMNVAPGFLQEDVQQGEENNLPAPRPGSIIRRTARTRIRKSHLPGDGGGRRFPASRRPRSSTPGDDDPAHRYSDGSEDNHQPERAGSAESYEYEERYQDSETSQPKHIEHRRGSDDTTDEGAIFDAYRSSRGSSISSESGDRSLTDSPESSPPQRKLSLPPITPVYSGGVWDEGEKTPTQESVNDPLNFRRGSDGPEEEPKLGMRKLSGVKLEVTAPFDTPRQNRVVSPTSQTPRDYDLPPGMAPPITRQPVPPGIALQHQKSQENLGPSPIDARPPLLRGDSSSPSVTPAPSSPTITKEKEKKSGFFGKKDKKEKEKKKEKEGFLGSLFGGKKKQEETVPVSSFGSAGPAAAAALLGSSKSAKAHGLSPGPSPTSPGFPGANGSFARYPIHVERAVYRLSHIKLANARRPLYEQVLISNLMFWYLGVIGRNVTEEKKADKEEKKETEVAKPPVVKGTPPKSVESGQAGNGLPLRRDPDPPSVPAPSVRQTPPPQQPTPPPSTKKQGLTKPERRRDGRDAEAAVRTPSYGMQNALVDSDLRAREAREQREQREAMKSPPQPRPNNGPPPHQYQQYAPPPGGQPPHLPRATSSPGIAGPVDPRIRQSTTPAPPGQGHQRPASDYGQPSPPLPREIQGAPRGVPQSSFGPPPPSQPNGQPIDPRQRTLSTPAPNQPMQQPSIGSGTMRRVVTEGRPDQLPPPQNVASRPMHPSHSGPQPGQIFQYPGSNGSLSPTNATGPLRSPSPHPPFPNRASSHPAPGQIFSPPPGAGPAPGQVFHHPQGSYGQPPQHNPNLPRPPPDQWAGPQRLPPPQPYPPQHHPHVRPEFTQQGFDPRRPPGQPFPQQGYPAHQQHRPPPINLGQPIGHPQEGQGQYQPYPQQGEYRRPQPVPGQFGHHR